MTNPFTKDYLINLSIGILAILVIWLCFILLSFLTPFALFILPFVVDKGSPR